MIGNIRNAWVRRFLLVVLAPLVVALLETVRLLNYLADEYGDDWRKTWNGPSR